MMKESFPMPIAIHRACGLALSVAMLAACNTAQNSAGLPGAVSAAKVSPDKSSNHPAEIVNQILPYPCYSGQTCPTDFEITFKGNVTADIPSNEPLDTHENAFCNPSGSQSCAPSVTYNSSSNTTTVEWSGPVVYHNRKDNQPGVHFGILAGQNQKTNIKSLEESSEWTYSSNPAVPMPIVSINSKQPTNSSKWKYAVVYIAGTTSSAGGPEYATWNEIAYVPKADDASTQPKLTFANYGTQTIYVTSSGIVTGLSVPTDKECLTNPACPDNLQLLGNLQALGFPPPGSASSPFEPLQNPPKVLDPQK
jgi:hypothetical protein